MRIAVLGSGGFIGHALTRRLKSEGHWVRGVDIKRPEFEPTAADQWLPLNLRLYDDARLAVDNVDQIYHLAADMGGIGYISKNHYRITRNNLLINTNVSDAVQEWQTVLYSSSACVYPQHLQLKAGDQKLKESDAWPADPEPGYGLEKLVAEKLFEYARNDRRIGIRVVRFHNVYGMNGTFQGGKEKAPAAACRKIALATSGDEIEVWGDGQQTRSFMYIDDCLEGLIRLMASGYQEPLNLGSEELVTIDQLFEKVAWVAGKKITLKHNLEGPQGVRGRNSDNTKLREILGWEPQIKLDAGLIETYNWIAKQVAPACSKGA